ncbi:AlpA family transcriptional regulator [Dechloromonas sp.]|uniref:helix-turn-helix transcriptional regulator n=1 Tax=Dechloromonas sp. TaxID=1917218 RepID=UPI002172D90A|nr:AlpA family transcriptional regulator [Dechloromonas sp.]MBU3696567.1 AlpA family transcriptional regulator [Dechloromonas sp.]
MNTEVFNYQKGNILEKVLKKKDVIAITGLSNSSIYLYIKAEKFPKPIKLGARRVGWKESEIQEWIDDKTKESRPDTMQ